MDPTRWMQTTFFPKETDVPEEFREGGVNLNHTLVGGELRPWDGSYAEVRSPICSAAQGDGVPQPLLIGRTPLMDEAAALEALDAAVQAYGQGSGDWTSMSVAVLPPPKLLRLGTFPPLLILTAQYLNSGIFPSGSSAGLVRRLAAAS